MANSFELANQVFGGQLESMLHKWFEQGDSIVTMTNRLQRLNIHVSREQVRRWCLKAGIDFSIRKTNA